MTDVEIYERIAREYPEVAELLRERDELKTKLDEALKVVWQAGVMHGEILKDLAARKRELEVALDNVRRLQAERRLIDQEDARLQELLREIKKDRDADRAAIRALAAVGDDMITCIPCEKDDPHDDLTSPHLLKIMGAMEHFRAVIKRARAAGEP